MPTTGRERTLGESDRPLARKPPAPIPSLALVPLIYPSLVVVFPLWDPKKTHTRQSSFKTRLMKEINNVERHSVAYPVHRVRPWPLRPVWSGSKHGRVPPRDDRSTRNRRLESFSQTPAGSVDARGLTGTRRQTVVGLQGPVGADI